MVGLKMSPLQGLWKIGFTIGYNLYIPSGLYKITPKVNQENMPVTYPFGRKFLFGGYVIGMVISIVTR